MVDIAEKLKNVPKGFKLYCTLVGDVLFESIKDGDNIKVCTDRNHFVSHHIFNRYGLYDSDGECLLFPSKEQRDWSRFSFESKVSHNFKPFDKVIVRDNIDGVWKADIFSHMSESNRFACTGGCSWRYCLPYNEETAKLIGRRRNYKEDWL